MEAETPGEGTPRYKGALKSIGTFPSALQQKIYGKLRQ